MASATLKRSLDCVEPAQLSPSSRSKRRCPSQFNARILCHSHHSHHYQQSMSPPQGPSCSNPQLNLPPLRESSPFAEIQTRLTEEVASNIRDEIKRLHHRRPLHDNSSKATHEPLVFSVRQTQLICERLIKERENRLREEYDKILASKLAEQYDTYVKFTFDQIQRQYDARSIPSYLS